MRIPNRVEAEGPLDATILICGEAIGVEEEQVGRPFVGSSGQLLDMLLSSVGIDRTKCYVTNVVKIRPPSNKLDRLGEYGLQLTDFYPELFNEVNEVKPNIIIALGNIPLEALTGISSVTKYRGSILEGKSEIGKVKVTYMYKEFVDKIVNRGDKGNACRDEGVDVFLDDNEGYLSQVLDSAQNTMPLKVLRK